MESALIPLIDRGARFTFVGDPFRSRKDIPNEDIEDLNFSQVTVTDADVEILLPLINLKGISFWNAPISDRSIELLAKLPRLERLNLCGTQITDASISTLIAMRLSYIDVAQTLLSQEGVETLRTGLPEAEILFETP